VTLAVVQAELAANSQLVERVVLDLNESPVPFGDDEFDTVSARYLMYEARP
jgi:hypothetical protein